MSRRPGAQARIILATLCISYAFGAGTAAGEGVGESSVIYDRPVLVLDPGMHTSNINAIAVDATGRTLITASSDKTIRVWDAATGVLQQTVHAPNGPNLIGEMYAVAIEPDGSLAAAGGWTDENSIYLIDPSRGKIVQRVNGMPNATTRLAFSADGRFLAVGTVGLRVFDREKHWEEVARDDSYGGEVYGLSFAADDRLATASADGLVRLYDAKFSLVHRYLRQQGEYPRSLAFSPDGNVLAVAYTSGLAPALVDGHTLTKLPDPQFGGHSGEIGLVAWSLDGQTLFSDFELKVSLVPGKIVSCGQAGRGPCQTLVGGVGSTIVGMAPLPAGPLIVAGSGRPYLAALNVDGSVRWEQRAPTANFQSLHPLEDVSADGTTVDFRFQPGNQIFRFDVNALNIVERTIPPVPKANQPRTQLQVRIDQQGRAELGGRPIAIDPSEVAESFAIDPTGSQFVVGTNSGLYLFAASGKLVWRRFSPADVRGLQIPSSGSLLVALLSDGTIRWYRSDTGSELLAMAPLAQGKPGPVGISVTASTLDWVAWTPDGFYTATSGANGALQWVANHGPDAEAISVANTDIPRLRRSDVVRLILRYRDVVRALGAADLEQVRNDIKVATNAQRPPGARLHVLAIGINDYGARANNLQLSFAEQDASDITNTLVETQGSEKKTIGLYAGVLPTMLPSAKASKVGIFRSLEDVQANMSKGDGRDVVVLFFSGHGANIDDDFYLLPNGVNAETTADIKASAIAGEQLQNEVNKLAAHGFVLVLLDACRSGAMTNTGLLLNPGADDLRNRLSHGNVFALTSSLGTEDSREDAKWGGHGAFTKVLLDALAGGAAIGGRGPISVGELTAYIQQKLPELTDQYQHLGVNPDFQHVTTNIFVTGN